MTTGIGCTLTVAGTTVLDGCTVGDPLDPTALSGLSVAWGRDTTMGQPEPSSCTFDVMDVPGGESFATRFRVGSTVRVEATGTLYPDPTESTFPDPGFVTGVGGWLPSNASAAITSGALQVIPLDASVRAGVQLAPLAFAPNGTEPDAWDTIPTTSPGQSWTFGVRVWAAMGAAVTVRPLLYRGPWAATVTPVPDAALTFIGDAAWHTVTGTFIPGVAGNWVGVEVATDPTGRRWLDATGTWAAAVGTWLDASAIRVDDVQVLAPAAGTARTVLVFAGRITDAETAWDDAAHTNVTRCSAVDFTADLNNRDIGDAPWLVEPMSTRFNRVLTLAGLPITATIDATVGALRLSWQDIDSQPAFGLLRSFAESTDAVMWPAAHATTGAYFKVEDAGQRSAILRLEMVGGVVKIVTAGGRNITACAIGRDPVKFVQSVSDVATRVAVTWLLQGTDENGVTTTEQTVTVVDTAAETTLGTRRVSLSTLLQSSADATAVANRVMARTDAIDWRVQGFEVDDDDTTDVDLMLTLIDGTARIGLPLNLIDLPAWAPIPEQVPVYVEGGSLTFEDGRWIAAMNVSRGAGLGTSVTWAQVPPAWRWVDVDPSIRWLDLIGVAGPAPAEERTQRR